VRNYPLGGLKAYCFSAGYLIKRHLDDKKVILGGITRNNTETKQKGTSCAQKNMGDDLFGRAELPAVVDDFD
jgi:hypothetical protein